MADGCGIFISENFVVTRHVSGKGLFPSLGGGDTDTDQTPTRRRETAKTWSDPERTEAVHSWRQVSGDIVGKTKILTFP